MNDFDGCQFPLLHDISNGTVALGHTSFKNQVKRLLANQWNHNAKKLAKLTFKKLTKLGILFKIVPASTASAKPVKASPILAAGDWVRIKSVDEIRATLDNWKELKGCAFIQDMWEYCGTEQQVLKPVERFLDERDYKVKKIKGVVILKGLICQGTAVFGRCDRGCHLFWRTEWLEKIEDPTRVGTIHKD